MIDVMNQALEGRYRVEALAGRGGMATVYRAVDLRHERSVAIKVMNPDFVESIGRDRFLREIRVTAGLAHPHLLALYDSGQIGDLLFYVMPFVDGMTLRQRLEAEGPLPLGDVVRIVREAAEALSYAHARGIVHRDVKPENILLSGYGADGTRARWNTLVADFGVSALTSVANDHLTATGIAVGSPQYMSPEQAIGEHVDARTDVWALGCVAYEMIEGRPPRGVPAFQRQGLPAAICDAIMRALTQDPSKRFDDAVEFADAFDRAYGTRRPHGPRAAWIVAAVVAALVLISGSAMLVRRRTSADHQLTRDSIALAAYNRGRSIQGIRSGASVNQAFSDFSRAIQRDSLFAGAWAGLARSAQLALLRGFDIRDMSRDSLLAVALFASRRALTLDSTNADVWVVRARVLESVDPTSRVAVLSDIRRALAIDSTNGDAWFSLARVRDELFDSAGARAAYAVALRLSPRYSELLSFRALHGLWTNQAADGLKWADSAIATDPTYGLAREAAALLATELRNWPLAERHLQAYQRIAVGPDGASALGHAARLAALRGDMARARRLAREAEQAVDSATLTKHQAAYLGEAFSAAGDTARAVHWLAAFSPRGDVHYQLHLHRDPALAWVQDRRYSWLLSEEESASPRRSR